jgi:hypothetical protein
MARGSTLLAIACITLSAAVPALAASGHGGATAHGSVTLHPNQGWTVATPTSTVRDHRNGNSSNPGGGVTITTGTPSDANLHHGGPNDSQPYHWRDGTVRDHRSGSGRR